MLGLALNLIFLCIQCMVLASTEHVFRCVYKPYGIQMCKRLCQDSPDAFWYTLEDYSCHRVSTNISMLSVHVSLGNCSNEDARANLTTVCPPQKGLNTSNTDENAPIKQVEMFEEATPTDGLELIQHNYNTSLYQACEEDKLDVVKYILSQGLEDINCRGRLGRTPVMAAARNGSLRVFNYLLTQSCDLSVIDENSHNILHVACIGGNVDIVRYLIDIARCDKESTGIFGRRPIMWAALYSHREVFEFLVSKGCNLTAVDKVKDSLLHLASFGGNEAIVRYILSQNIISVESRGHTGRTAMMKAAMNGHKGIFDILLKEGCSLTDVDDNNNNILHLSCYYGRVHIVKHILSLGKISLESKDYQGRTPVMQAVRLNHKDTVEFLNTKGCSLTSVDDDGNNILHVACEQRCVDIVKYLMTLREVEGMEKVENKYGRTPMQEAENRGCIDVVRFLGSTKL